MIDNKKLPSFLRILKKITSFLKLMKKFLNLIKAKEENQFF